MALSLTRELGPVVAALLFAGLRYTLAFLVLLPLVASVMGVGFVALGVAVVLLALGVSEQDVVDDYLLTSTIDGVLAQRLVRRVCPACAEPVRGELTPDERRMTMQGAPLWARAATVGLAVRLRVDAVTGLLGRFVVLPDEVAVEVEVPLGLHVAPREVQDLAADHAVEHVIAAFDQYVGKYLRDQRSRRIVRKRYDPVDRGQAGKHQQSIGQRIYRPRFAFQPPH